MVKIAAVQRSSAGSKEHNIDESLAFARRAARRMPDLDLVLFPEYNNFMAPSPGESLKYAETLDGPYVTAMRDLARELHCYVHTGSFSERVGNKVKNTILVFDREGELAGRYSKIHLSDAMGFKESDYVSAGDELGLVDTDFGRLGICVCYDLRFPEQTRSMAVAGADILLISALWPCGNPLPPRTGHWDVLTRACAIHNLCYVVACNQFGPVGGEIPFGDSRVIDPWGAVIAQASEGTQIVLARLDMEYQRRIRESVATYENRRPELYRLV